MSENGSDGLAVVTRHGALVHWPDRGALRHARTFCGREWIDLHTPDASWQAVTCSVCQARALLDDRKDRL